MKIKPLTYELSKEAIASIESNLGDGTIDLSKSKNTRKSNSLVIAFKEPPRMNYYTPVIYKNNLYAAFFPNPTHLFFAQAIEHSETVDRIEMLFPDNVEHVMNPNTKDEFNILTSDIYYKYLIYKISSITSLIMTVESFINFLIPENFTFTENSNDKILHKSDIEKSFNLKQKITVIIPKIISIQNLKNYQKLYNKILEINSLRNEFIHLKTKRDKHNADPFIDHFESLINLNLSEKINDTKKFIDFLKPDYF